MTPPLRLVWRLSASGDLRDLPAAVAEALPSEHPGTLLLELAALPGPFDARDLDVLAGAALHARRRGWTLRVTGAPPPLVELIELAGLGAALLGT